MLIITRRVGESLNIGDDIKIVLLEANGAQAKLGISAPRDIPVFRDEIYRKIQEDKINQKDTEVQDSYWNK